MIYRHLVYENSKGEKVYLNIPYYQFLYELEGAGFSYTNEIDTNNYNNFMTSRYSEIDYNTIKGTLMVHDTDNKNKNIYITQEETSKILNYDQLRRRTTREDIQGKLIYTNASGIEVYTPALIKNFSFDEIKSDYKELEIAVEFDRLSKVWYKTIPKRIKVSLEGEEDAHFHPYYHKWVHGDTYLSGNNAIENIRGTDMAKLNVKITGEISDFIFNVVSSDNTFERHVIYKDFIVQGDVLEINNFLYYARKNGVNAMRYFDLINGDSPFFDIYPNKTYSVSVDSENLRGSVEFFIYESYISVP